MAGTGAGIYTETLFDSINRTVFFPKMPERERRIKYYGWQKAVDCIISAKDYENNPDK